MARIAYVGVLPRHEVIQQSGCRPPERRGWPPQMKPSTPDRCVPVSLCVDQLVGIDAETQGTGVIRRTQAGSAYVGRCPMKTAASTLNEYSLVRLVRWYDRAVNES